jgi:hypothetical protein
MNRPSFWLRLGLLVAMAGAVGCNSRTAIPTKHTTVGFGTSTNNFAISGGHLVDHPGKPGVTFGTLTTNPKNPTELTYVILFKLPPPTDGSSFGMDGHGRSVSTGGGEVKSRIRINGKGIEATAYYELNADRTAVSKEKLTIGGKEVDPDAGRLFLLDLRTAEPVYQQKKIALPDGVPKLEKTGDVEAYVELLLKHLREKEPELKDWVK